MSFEDQVRPIERANLAFGAGAVATSAVLAPPAFAASVAVGAVLEALNYRAMTVGARRMFSGETQGQAIWMALFALRFLMLGGAIFLAVRGGLDGRGLALGFSVILPASILGAWRVRPEPGPATPAPPPDDPSWDDWNPWLARERPPVDDWDAE